MTRAHDVEWVGGVFALPASVAGEGEPFPLEALVWVETVLGLVVGHEVGKVGELVHVAADVLLQAAANPPAGPPHGPTRVRVASEVLANALRGAIGEIEIVVAPTPELDPVVAAMVQFHAASNAPTYFGERVTVLDLDAAFDALAQLHRAKPWAVIPSDSLVAVRCEAGGMTEGALCVVGQHGESFGFILFPSLADWDAYLDFIDAHEAGTPRAVPPHTMVSFDGRRELPGELLREIEAHHWTIAAADGFPHIEVFDTTGEAGLPDREQLAVITAVINALVELLRDTTLVDAWDDGRLRTASAIAPVPATVMAPLFSQTLDDRAIDESFVGFDGAIDVDALDDHRETLVARFLRSPAGKPFEGTVTDELIEWAARACHASMLELRPHELRLVLFDVFPEMLPAEGTEAPAIVAELRAFLGFLATELGSRQAERCLAALPADATARLAAALDDPANFGPAKQFLLEGVRAGFDMATAEGIAAWMKTPRALAMSSGSAKKPAGAKKQASAAAVKKKQRAPAAAKKPAAALKKVAIAVMKLAATTKTPAVKPKPAAKKSPAAAKKQPPAAKRGAAKKRSS